eukprot:TRINITY_DN1483_c0_g1_i1.p1 TRINITY_DN1483_c0_g1~~TRINITY_DN1483_c0_g1_i1.p1  ORF type:complete len:207 (+),score=45.45 TRINITY_DN1483_c0_g1_i1:48-668(+)
MLLQKQFRLLGSSKSFGINQDALRSFGIQKQFAPLAVVSRSTSRVSLFTSNAIGFKANSMNQKRAITVVPTTLEALKEKNASIKKPISPHVTIYKFPLPAWTSITTRVTGVALTVGVYGAGIATLWGSPHTLEYAIEAIKYSSPALVYLIKLSIAFPLVYHYVSGLRHLYWDFTATGIDTKSVEQSSLYMLGIIGVLTLGFTFFSL